MVYRGLFIEHSWTSSTGPRGLILPARVLIERLSLSRSSISLCDPGRVLRDPPITKGADSDREMTIMPLMKGTMSSSSSSNSKSRSGSRSPATHSDSSSGSTSKSVSGSASESASKSVSRSSHGSYSTSPKRNKKFPISKLQDEHAGPSTLAKFQDRLAKNPWEAVVSKVRTPVLKIREKYHIPSDFDIIIPATFDRMHRPPEGFSAFSIKHLDVGLRFPLAPPVAAILNKLGLCPMQLSPNSITHIILFVVIMQFVGLETSFDNFWSLYSFTTSKRSGSRGFFYLSAKPDCGYLSALKPNVGAWLDRYIFIRPSRGV
ncbi:UNVERIFIED_CONTAM: hypothetical protein Sindi_2341600 [Sesamum indicum]